MRDLEIDADLVQRLLTQSESRLVERKERWYDLAVAQGKAELAKDVLAFANTLEEGEVAYVLFGVQDEDRGGHVVGVSQPPSAEQVTQVLADYTVPPPRTSLRSVSLVGGEVSVLAIIPTAARPHHAVRQHTNVLNPSVVYVRRDRINGAATSQEVEAMIRSKISRLGPIVAQTPLKAGFVGQGHTDSNRTLVIRVTNVTESVVAGIDVLIDLIHIGLPQLTARERPLTNLALQPGESREAEVSLRNPQFYVRWIEEGPPARIKVSGVIDYGHHVGDRWLNAVMRVYYRDEDGFLHEITRELAIDA